MRESTVPRRPSGNRRTGGAFRVIIEGSREAVDLRLHDTERSLSMQLQFTTSPLLGDSRLPTRFWQKVRLLDNGCWEWTGAIDARGYARFRLRERNALAHRVAYEHCVGPVPKGLDLDHLCRNHPCVNPEHLEPVTRRENLRRGHRRRPTHCPQGHPYAGSNLYQYGNHRHCRACTIRRSREWYHSSRKPP